MIRAESSGGSTLGQKVGTLLTWNTLGAVAGTLVAGFVLMPLIGLRNAFGALALAFVVNGLDRRFGVRAGGREKVWPSAPPCSPAACSFLADRIGGV